MSILDQLKAKKSTKVVIQGIDLQFLPVSWAQYTEFTKIQEKASETDGNLKLSYFIIDSFIRDVEGNKIVANLKELSEYPIDFCIECLNEFSNQISGGSESDPKNS